MLTGKGRVPLVVVLLALALACGPGSAPHPERILLVTIDTLRADHLGCYGASDAHTPHLDTIAAEGVRFDVAVSPSPLTLPAHASIMTSLDPPAHGVRHNSLYRLGDALDDGLDEGLDDPLPTLAEALSDAGFATAAFVGALVLDARFGLDRGFAHYDDAVEGRRSGTIGYAERSADRVVDAALEWLATAPDRFFLWVHFYDPHASYDPPPGFAAAFAGRPYAGEIAFVDSQLGRLLEGVERAGRGGAEGGAPLLVAVASDHGESLGEHGEPTHSYSLYEATQRVPLLLRGPGLPRGLVVAQAVRLIDLAPTVLGLAGARPLGGPAAEWGGRDLRPLFQGARSQGAESEGVLSGGPAAYLETVATRLDFGWSPLLGLRTERYKYVRAPRPELYDLTDDPGEQRNVAASRPSVVVRLDRELDARLQIPRRGSRPVTLSPRDRARLESLGYVVGPTGAAHPDLERVGGVDPKDAIGVLEPLSEAQGLLTEGRATEALDLLASLGEAGVVVTALRAAAAVSAGDGVAAERDARAVLAVEPRREDIWVVLGRALEAQGRLAEAKQAYAAALAIAPNQSGAREGLARLGASPTGDPEPAPPRRF